MRSSKRLEAVDMVTILRSRLNILTQHLPWLILFITLLLVIIAYHIHDTLAGFVRGPFGALDSDSVDAVGIFLTIVGLVYALILGFTMHQALEKQRKLAESVLREVTSIHTILLLTQSMRTGDKEKEIIANLSRYVDHLCEDALEHNTPLFDDNHTSIYSILDILNEIANDGLDDEVDRISLHAIHDELRNLSSHRCERMASSRQRMPHTQWFNLEFLAVLILIGFLMIDLTSAAIEALLFALSTGSISVLMLVIHDLDDPFNGIFRIDNSPYLELREEFSKTLNEVTLE